MALENIDVKPIIEEFVPEKKKEPVPYREIRKNIASSDAVFLFLTDNIMMTEHTKNWVIFEDGIAAASRKQLFLFERKGIPLKYPVPYVTDYAIFDESDIKDILKIQELSKRLKKFFSAEENASYVPPSEVAHDAGSAILWAMRSFFRVRAKKKLLQQFGVFKLKCPICKVEFYYHTPEHSPFICPACRGEKLYCKKNINSARAVKE